MIRKKGVRFGNAATIRENQAMRANLRIDSRELGHLSSVTSSRKFGQKLSHHVMPKVLVLKAQGRHVMGQILAGKDHITRWMLLADLISEITSGLVGITFALVARYDDIISNWQQQHYNHISSYPTAVFGYQLEGLHQPTTPNGRP